MFFFFSDLHILTYFPIYVCRTSGNLCLSFSSRCTDLSENPSLQTPEVTVFTPKHRHGHSRKAVLVGTIAGALCALLVITLAVFMYKRRKEDEVPSSSSIIPLKLSYYKLILLPIANSLLSLFQEL